LRLVTDIDDSCSSNNDGSSRRVDEEDQLAVPLRRLETSLVTSMRLR
jgi:hypothetical protein